MGTISPGSNVASAGPLASRFGRPRFPNWRRLIGTAGPGLLIAVGYVDPGNWATDLGGGSRYGYALLSMVLIANLIAMVAQALCVRLAIATGKSLAELSREAYSRPVVLLLWLLAEVAMVATDLGRAGGRSHRPQAPVRNRPRPRCLAHERRHTRPSAVRER